MENLDKVLSDFQIRTPTKIPEVRDLIFQFRQIQKQVDVLKAMTQRGFVALFFTLCLISLLFLLYEIVGFNWADTLLASDGEG